MASKVAWAGRTTSMVLGLALIMALIFGVTSVGLAANGQPFLLGKAKNTATKVSGLIGKVAGGPALKVSNPSGGAALGLQVNSGQAPLTVNSSVKVAKLNADRLDGSDSKDLLPGGAVPGGTTIRGIYELDGSADTGSELVGGDSISFVYTLPSTPQAKFIPKGTTPPAGCPGTVASPQAQPGYLCVYEIKNGNQGTGSPFLYNASPTGAALYADSAAAGPSYSYGRWAVTAPNSAQVSSLQKSSAAATTQRKEP